MGSELFLFAGLAFLGGVILNVMPCVLPVLTMKVFHVIEGGQDDPSTTRKHGVAYAAGVQATFLVFASIVVGLKLAGSAVGWGMQFQNPAFVAALCLLMVVFGLNALGVFEFTVSVAGKHRDGYGESFFNGVVASVMATPCSAPFLGPAAAAAMGSDAIWYETFIILNLVGVGLAFPFLIISFVPAAARLLPRPGAWMETFKQVMGFSLLFAATALYWVLLKQISADSAGLFLAFIAATGMGLWAIDRFGGLMYGTARRYGVRFAVIGLLVFTATTSLRFDAAANTHNAVAHTEPVVKDGKINWTGFSPSRVELARKRGRPVFVDYTADWCANCKTMEKTVLETDAIRSALTKTNVLPVKADWTNEGDEIFAWLQKVGRSSIPTHVIYYPDGTYDLLPELYGADTLVEKLEKASAKHPSDGFLSIEAACVADASPVIPADDANVVSQVTP
jgi:thiol:disulfide interchange protein